ncbi:MAG: 6-phosphogluconolactonase [Pseudomonadota bacterium]
MTPPMHIFDDRSALDAALAKAVASHLAAGIRERGAATLVVSGGSTPDGFFSRLRDLPLDWSSIAVTLADERWVGPDHEDSNARLVSERLLQGPAAAARFVPLFVEDIVPEDAEEALGSDIAALGTFDAVVLGMGGDAHFASLFPGAEALATGLSIPSDRQCLAVRPNHAPHARMSLSLARLFDSRFRALHIVGDEKNQVLKTAMASADSSAFPIAAVFEAGRPHTDVYWAP